MLYNKRRKGEKKSPAGAAVGGDDAWYSWFACVVRVLRTCGIRMHCCRAEKTIRTDGKSAEGEWLFIFETSNFINKNNDFFVLCCACNDSLFHASTWMWDIERFPNAISSIIRPRVGKWDRRRGLWANSPKNFAAFPPAHFSHVNYFRVHVAVTKYTRNDEWNVARQKGDEGHVIMYY